VLKKVALLFCSGETFSIFKDFPELINKIQGFPRQQKNPRLFQDVATLGIALNISI